MSRHERRDGYVSIEVSPYLAMDTDETIEEARRLWRDVGRANLMVKVPATKPGLPAIRTLIGEGINVNITLLFSQQVYEEVVEAYHRRPRGLSSPRAAIRTRSRASPASSSAASTRPSTSCSIRRSREANDPAEKRALAALKGKVAIANAKLAYQRYKRHLRGRALGDARAQGRTAAAPALGQHRHQEPGLQRRALCRGADRPGHRQHDAAGDDGRVPRSRAGCAPSLEEDRRRRAARHGGAGRAPASRSTT